MNVGDYLSPSYITSFRSRRGAPVSPESNFSSSSVSSYLSSPLQSELQVPSFASQAPDIVADSTANPSPGLSEADTIDTAISAPIEQEAVLSSASSYPRTTKTSGSSLGLLPESSSVSVPLSSTATLGSPSSPEIASKASRGAGSSSVQSGADSELDQEISAHHHVVLNTTSASRVQTSSPLATIVTGTSTNIPVESSSQLPPSSSVSALSSMDSLVANQENSSHKNPAVISTKEGQIDMESTEPGCAICLEGIKSRHHAKAILACRHEFHLSCISMAFAMGKEMICPLCRYLHKDQPFMNMGAEDDVKPSASGRPPRAIMMSTSTSTAHQRRLFQQQAQSIATLHEHPTSGTVLSMMPSLFETTLGHGPAAGTIRTSPDGICLKTSTWLMLYAMPFSVALCLLAFVLGKVETMWSKVSCLIGAAICYMVCWALVVAIMDPDHEARALLERLNQQELSSETQQNPSSPSNSSAGNRSGIEATTGTLLTESSSSSTVNPNYPPSAPSLGPLGFSWGALIQHRYTRGIQNRVMDLAGILDDIPDMMAEW
ncbi:hypothetical protein BC939DRAFT_456961 [Gamsiella multidivaricata]|uniref:uncharacterized protein n=1 Tax=Gamsiella multidivaricata TaxID=101098 RepID=UPI00221FA5FD|nr:uncharacterized protein BC939DRAFT_456961 [Gamsiella multidivaricata]KAG0365836.1 hypothetical protein BGZ54_006169 [Gamsiella multidivaricata]KAI7820792.1 hypothetical protein BC939DRAFT_456961 [Gamsiella multidivaricata]